MCTVLLRFAPDTPWPVLLGAIRDEFADRAWDPPGHHWVGPWSGLLGGRDRTAGGTWLAVDPSTERPAMAAVLNGVRRPPINEAVRPTRGTLALDVLATGRVPDDDVLPGYDGFHLLLATLSGIQVWSWDGETFDHRDLSPGDHIVVNLGVDTHDDPLVPHFEPLLAALPSPVLTPGLPTRAAWEPWTELLDGGGLDPTDPRALIVRREIEGRTYASTSASLVGLSPRGARYDFSPAPTDFSPAPTRPAAWYEVGPVVRR